MDGNVRRIEDYIKGTKQLIIPVYQRNYAWSIKNCERLFDDLITAYREDRDHFFGSVVVKPGSLTQENIIIDGQQRITTISLLYLAISRWKENHHKANQIINVNYLSNLDDEDEDELTLKFIANNLKLHLNPRDAVDYQKLFGDEKLFNEGSNITKNYRYFYDRLNTLNIAEFDKPRDLVMVKAIKKLEVMLVNLSYNDDAQSIFESLNSTGVDLTEGDKIRNFLLMNESIDNQNFYFNNYWEPIENRVTDVSNFFKDFLALRLSKTPNNNNIYWNFVDFYHKNITDKKTFFDELNDYSLAYQQILNNNTGDEQIDDILYRFNKINTTVIRPFLMAIIVDLNNHQINAQQVAQIFSVVEVYIARRMIVKIPSNALNGVFKTLYHDMTKLAANDPEVPLATIVSYLLLKKKNSARLPNDDEVKNALLQNDFYHINSFFRTYLFERFENYDHVENLRIYQGVEEQKYSVEHIMPQHLNQSWKNDLGPDWENVHLQYLNTIGNLTLTGYNTKYSNRAFKEKQTMAKGFKDSHFVNLNKLPATATKWDQAEIVARTNELIQRALQIWAYPHIDYTPTVIPKAAVIYDGTQHFIGDKIQSYTFMDNNVHNVNTWKDFYIELVQQLADIDINPLRNYAEVKSNNNGINYRLFVEKNDVSNDDDYFEVSSGIFVHTAISNWDKFQSLKHLLDDYQISYDNLNIYLREQ
ncbi:MAG: DUF262 domain-containing HNH endonuclease family protein [Candidatus Paralactobacillus gallistercoris]|uniref:DUF262 domain-containing HNH endonuclease family protein n=1 Tax=Candidatus Paralactobacillus gallistercoris TaxID=2838724 RepID=A0A948X1C8_9LACO|nr:DUF262 domain-containing HNH endonuclease family protein [Candidatus Paralactobacillus gallistercoris]